MPAPNDVIYAGLGNSQQGVYIDGNNTTVGGTNPQENNVIVGNGSQGMLIDVHAHGNVVEGNQIGIIGPSTNGRYFQMGNQARGRSGLRLEQRDRRAWWRLRKPDLRQPASTASGSSDRLRPETSWRGTSSAWAPEAGICLAPGNPGNRGDGVGIENSTQNQVGGPSSTWANVISSNGGAGVDITGITSTGNTVQYNLIGLTADGKAVKGNYADGSGRVLPANTDRSRAM